MPNSIKLGISTCPNDTFAFHGLIERLVDWRGIQFKVELLDIQELNQGMREGYFDVAKASFFAALSWADRMVVLPSGSALGFGVGPLLLAARPNITPSDWSQLTLCPGQETTANLLFQLFYPSTSRIQQTVFSDIMPRLAAGQADFGVCIHEGRFTWQQSGLHLVEDLGQRWETETGCPLPLGGIVARRDLGADLLRRIQATIFDSLSLSLLQPELPLPTMRRHAQEFDDRVLQQHVELYVNQWTLNLGGDGSLALREMHQRALRSGLLPEELPPLEIWRDSAGD
jgi:1,4-dihydroxy-6-naphthoate synthase